MRRRLAALAFVALAASATAQPVQDAPPAGAGAPASAVVVPALPAPGDSNAERARKQPGNNAPFWRGVRDSGGAPGTVNNLQMGEPGVLIQPFTAYPGTRFASAGEAWRQIRNDWIIPWGGALVFIVLLALAIFWFAKGPMGHATNTEGRAIERFTAFERATHWSNAIAFVVLAVSGIVMAFGKFFLLPLIGAALFGWLTWALKTLHNFVGPLFAVSLVIMFVTFLRGNWPQRGDLRWLLKGGGMIGKGGEPPSNRYNAGEKLVFWVGVLILGGIVVASGLVLDKLIPGLAYTRPDMQVAHIVHAIAALLMVAVFAFHIYVGTVGIRGAYRAMKTGYVDERWAAEHHRLWYDDIAAGRIAAQRSRPPPPPRIEQPAV